jgi:hypothetical protein
MSSSTQRSGGRLLLDSFGLAAVILAVALSWPGVEVARADDRAPQMGSASVDPVPAAVDPAHVSTP